MNENKLNDLFRAARQQQPPEARGLFHLKVMEAIRQQPSPEPFSLLESLGTLFPRLGLAAACIITLCVAAEVALSFGSGSDLSSGIAQISQQWLFTANGL